MDEAELQICIIPQILRVPNHYQQPVDYLTLPNYHIWMNLTIKVRNRN